LTNFIGHPSRGEPEMTKHMIRHIRFVLTSLAAVGFGISFN
jgi:hypothetical protein